MLNALYQYAARMNLTLPPGFADKTIKAFIMVDAAGDFVGIQQDDGNKFRCPDIGSMANSTDKSNLLVEKRSVVLPEAPTAKNEFFRSGLRDLAEAEPLAGLCLRVLETPEVCDAIRAALDRIKIKEADRISFLVDNRYLVECPSVRAWWPDYRRQFLPTPKAEDVSLCLITGQPTVPMATVPKTAGLSIVGGHASGDALICFDKNAFCSYGLKKSANAPVSEEAFAQVKTALDALLRDAPILAGMKFVHWYDTSLPKEEDCILTALFAGIQDDDEEDEADEAEAPDIMAQAKREADRLIQAVPSGQAVHALPHTYYILLLSGAGGRVMVRQFTHGSYAALTQSLDAWNADLRLTNPLGTADLGVTKLTARLIHLLKHQKNDRKVFERLGKELAGVSPIVVSAILNNTRLPDSVAARALSYIRSQMLCAEGESAYSLCPDPIACQWLKVWLIRNQKEVHLMSDYNPQHPDAAYHCGALMAVYAALQQRAYPDVNVTVVQRYFTSAMQTPAFVLARLASMSTHHLAKLPGKFAARYFTEKLAEIGSRVGDRIPATLALADQSLFVLGYYQMSAALIKENRERFAKIAADQEEE